MDELSLKKLHKLYVTVMSDLSDPEHPRVLAVVKGRDREAAEKCLAMLAPQQRKAVRSHRTDMSRLSARLPRAVAEQPTGVGPLSCGEPSGRVDGPRENKSRRFKLALSAAERRKFRSRMWQFRRHRRDLTQQDEDELYALFASLPDLELPYRFREGIAKTFDTAPNRKAASARLEALREVVANEPELLEFFAFHDRWRDRVLAYFDRRETSAAVEDQVLSADSDTLFPLRACPGVRDNADAICWRIYLAC